MLVLSGTADAKLEAGPCPFPLSLISSTPLICVMVFMPVGRGASGMRVSCAELREGRRHAIPVRD